MFSFTKASFPLPKSSLAMSSVTSRVYATNVFFLRRDNFFASEGRVQAFRRIDDDRGNLLLQYAEAQLDFCPLQLSLRLLSLSIAIPNNLRTGGVGHKTLEPTEYILPDTYRALGRSLILVNPAITHTCFTLQPFMLVNSYLCTPYSPSCRTSQIPTHEISNRPMVGGCGLRTLPIGWPQGSIVSFALHFNRRTVHAKDLETAHSCMRKTRVMIKTTDSYSKDLSTSNK